MSAAVQIVFCMDTEGPCDDPSNPELLASWDAVDAAMDRLFSIYSDALPRVAAWASEAFPPQDGQPTAAHERALGRPASRSPMF